MKSQKTDEGLPDIIAPHLKVLFCGLNPGLGAVIAGHHFESRSNRFWRVLHLAGFTPNEIDSGNDGTLLSFGYGLTTAVPRATRSASEVGRHEYLSAREALEQRIRHYSPKYVAFLGKAAYVTLSGNRDVAWGPRNDEFGGTRVWILPNPSGLNRAFSLEALVDAYEPLRVAANL